MPRAVLNGHEVTLPEAPSLAEALRAVGVHLPALCHDERLAHAGTMTGRSRTRELRPTDLLEIAPADADAMDILDGDLVQIASRYGKAVLPAHVNTAIRSGELFATFQTAGTLLNAITGPHVDRATGTPEYKVTAVHIEKRL